MGALKVESFYKKYGRRAILDHISFTVEENEVIGIIGQNGAGKTTLIESILGLRSGYDGKIKIYGQDIKDNPKRMKYLVGAQLQNCVINKSMRVNECIDLQAAIFKIQVNMDQRLEEFNLLEKKRAKIKELSGGQLQRLFALLSNLHNPKILFFDELTTGLDPEARNGVYKFILNLRKQGTTIFMSTHFMEELNLLCDRVIILKNKKIVQNSTPRNLVGNLDFQHILSYTSDNTLESINKIFAEQGIDVNPYSTEIRVNQYEVKIANEEKKQTVKSLVEQRTDVFENVSFREASMDDVYNKYCIK